MESSNFFDKAGSYGICGCAGVTFLTNSELYENPEPDCEEGPDWQMKFVKARFSKLTDLLDKNVDKNSKSRILENLGREGARQGFFHIRNYIGQIDKFLVTISGEWAEKAIYDKEKNEIKIIGKSSEKSGCPFVDQLKKSGDFCNCSLGWQKEAFKTILGENVDARVDESVLQGGKSCNFTIRAL